jgi:hypothetical protein
MDDLARDELARVRARVAELEAMAAAPPRIGLETALADHFSPDRPVDPARARLESIARGFVPSDGMEDALRARAKDRRGYDREMARVRVGGLDLALYANQRAAAIKLGTFVPETEGDQS